jgi:hypothetical protein
MIEFVIMKAPDCYVGYVPSMMYVASSGLTREDVMADLLYQVSMMCDAFFEEETMSMLNELNITLNESDESRTS